MAGNAYWIAAAANRARRVQAAITAEPAPAPAPVHNHTAILEQMSNTIHSIKWMLTQELERSMAERAAADKLLAGHAGRSTGCACSTGNCAIHIKFLG